MNRILSIGRLIPLLVALTGLTELGMRFLPTAWFSIRLDEPSRRYRIGITDLTPGFHYDKPRAYGDLANFTGSPDLRFYRREWKRVDTDGFRQDGAPATPARPPECVLFGDSFASGVALSDDATLAAQYSRLPGRSMVDSSLRPDWRRIRFMIDYLGMTKGTVVMTLVDRQPLPGVEEFEDRPPPDTTWHKQHHVITRLWDGYWEVSPLKILSERMIRRLQNGRLLPNPRASVVTVETLVNGQPFLFYDQDMAAWKDQESPDVSGLLLLQERLSRRRIHLFVLLVPNKYTVYHRLIKHPPPELPGPSRDSLFEAALRGAGISVLNLESIFLTEAQAALKKGDLLYWPDDTHWNSNGTRIAAEALARTVLRNRTQSLGIDLRAANHPKF